MSRPVKKIKIEIENIMVDSNLTYIYDHILNDKIERELRNGNIPSSEFVNGSIITYNIYEIHNNIDDSRYYVAINDKIILEELLSISSNQIEMMKLCERQKGKVEGEYLGYKQGASSVSKFIKNLPWYKRLFNMF